MTKKNSKFIINQPTFNEGSHQFATKIINNNAPKQVHYEDLVSFIPKKDLSTKEMDILKQFLRNIDFNNINQVDWWDIFYTMKNATDKVNSKKKKNKLNEFFINHPNATSDNKGEVLDTFLSFAEEDVTMAESLYHELSKTSLNTWFSRVHLKTGDSIIGVINEAIAKAKYGIVLMSNHTLNDKNHFPILELNSLINKKLYQNLELIIIYHNITYQDVLRAFPLISDIFAIDSSIGIKRVRQKISEKVGLNMQ